MSLNQAKTAAMGEERSVFSANNQQIPKAGIAIADTVTGARRLHR